MVSEKVFLSNPGIYEDVRTYFKCEDCWARRYRADKNYLLGRYTIMDAINGSVQREAGRIGRSLKKEAENELSNPFEEAILKHNIEMDSGYVNVRRGVAMFWWLFYADGKREGSKNKPMIVWVQGGPGLPASGVGNFMEIGPLDSDFNKRNHSWTNGHNLLLIDSPVGTGFSHANKTNFAALDKDVVTDFVNTVYGFMRVHPEFRETAWHLFSQSYGGKLAPKIGYRLHSAIKRGDVRMNLKTVAIGSGFVDPRETIQASADYLFHIGLIDYTDYIKFKQSATAITKLIQMKKYQEAFFTNMQKFEEIPHIKQFNKNNINEGGSYQWFYDLEKRVNMYVKPVLKSTRPSDQRWECFPTNVYLALHANLLLSSKKYVEKLLNETSIKVIVYNGNFDAVTPMAGCVNWVHKLHWSGGEQFTKTKRETIPGRMLGFYKAHKTLSLWWVLSAGHWVPNDNPAAMKEILKYATENV